MIAHFAGLFTGLFSVLGFLHRHPSPFMEVIMQRLLSLSVLPMLALACGTGETRTALQGAADSKVLICHGTASATNPYVKISVSQAALETHLNGHGQHNHPNCLFDPTPATDCWCRP